jgi:hypothetical protein
MRNYKIVSKITFLLLFVSFVGCENGASENIPNENEKLQPDFTLIAGDVLSDSINYFEFLPYIKVKGRRIGVDTNYTYNDSVSIDLDNDNRPDLHYKYYMRYLESCCNNPGTIDCCMPSVSIECQLKTELNVEIATKIFYNNRIPVVFHVGDTIDCKSDWHSYNVFTPFSFAGMGELWDSNRHNNYMGIRIIENNDTLYGWIRLNTLKSTSIELYDYVLEKER